MIVIMRTMILLQDTPRLLGSRDQRAAVVRVPGSTPHAVRSVCNACSLVRRENNPAVFLRFSRSIENTKPTENAKRQFPRKQLKQLPERVLVPTILQRVSLRSLLVVSVRRISNRGSRITHPNAE